MHKTDEYLDKRAGISGPVPEAEATAKAEDDAATFKAFRQPGQSAKTVKELGEQLKDMINAPYGGEMPGSVKELRENFTKIVDKHLSDEDVMKWAKNTLGFLDVVGTMGGILSAKPSARVVPVTAAMLDLPDYPSATSDWIMERIEKNIQPTVFDNQLNNTKVEAIAGCQILGTPADQSACKKELERISKIFGFKL